MRSAISIALLLGFICVALAQQKYTPKYDNVNIETVLSNDRVLSNYIACLLDKKPCTREGRDLKKLLPDAIQSDCSKCTEPQKRNSRKVITFLRTKRPQDWKKLTDKYDPQGRFKERLDAGLI